MVMKALSLCLVWLTVDRLLLYLSELAISCTRTFIMQRRVFSVVHWRLMHCTQNTGAIKLLITVELSSIWSKIQVIPKGGCH